MRVLKWTAKTGIPTAIAGITRDFTWSIPAMWEHFKNNAGKLGNHFSNERAKQMIKEVLLKENEDKRYDAVREFRKDFEKLIEQSKQGEIVVLIDDLDRCLPRHIIENLEAKNSS